MNKRLTVLLQTSKDRIRYLDTTFNSLRKVLPADIHISITCNNPSDSLLTYLTTNKSVELNDKDLYPNENLSWKRYVGEIENKKTVKGIMGCFNKLILLEQNLHQYERLCVSLQTIINEYDSEYVLYVEDDMVFKKNFYRTILKCMVKLKELNAGRVTFFKYNIPTQKTILKNINSSWKGTNMCLLLKTSLLKRMNLNSYKFTINDLPLFLRKDLKEGDEIPQSGADEFLSGLVQKYTNSAEYTATSVCQHIGVLSAIYNNVNFNEEWDVRTSQRCFFDKNNNVSRVDRTCQPPFVL